MLNYLNLLKQPAQALAEKLLKEAIDSEMEDFLLSVVADQYDIENEKKLKVRTWIGIHYYLPRQCS
ncbi:hypothetical protein GZ064_03620 [Wolbachia endosymbiont of Diaphorina citri]|uniref:hypothetical protein n=1 Tax=unclassified Wolbachia TaxID=2640676 RepID=UPI0003167FBF|nr:MULTISPECIES: hypothetical protein [unclassified Wolbachia]QXY87026.1 hypothetical protein GZ064_03620 [Wolbachia endosymbiont of Diaphorina citri]